MEYKHQPFTLALPPRAANDGHGLAAAAAAAATAESGAAASEEAGDLQDDSVIGDRRTLAATTVRLHHELNNAMAVIVSATELLALQAEVPAQARPFLSLIMQGSMQVTDLLRRLDAVKKPELINGPCGYPMLRLPGDPA